MPVVITIGGAPPTEADAAALRAAFGIPEPVNVLDTKNTLVAADQFILRDSEAGGAFKLTTATAIASFAGVTPEENAPAAFGTDDWRINSDTNVEVLALPSSDPAITDIQISVNSGSAVSLGGTTVDEYTISALSPGDSVRIRAVNPIGAGTWSGPKVYTVAGAMEWGDAGTPYAAVSGTSHSLEVPSSAVAGNWLVVPFFPFGNITGIQTNTGQALTLLGTYASAGEVGRVYGVQLSGTMPATVDVTLSETNDFMGQVFVARGVNEVAGTVLDGSDIDPRENMTYATDAADALVLVLYTAGGGRAVDEATFVGGGPADLASRWAFTSQGVIAGVHSGATGTNNVAVTWDATDTGGGRWAAFAFKA